jgi:hypothetical protein
MLNNTIFANLTHVNPSFHQSLFVCYSLRLKIFTLESTSFKFDWIYYRKIILTLVSLNKFVMKIYDVINLKIFI